MEYKVAPLGWDGYLLAAAQPQRPLWVLQRAYSVLAGDLCEQRQKLGNWHKSFLPPFAYLLPCIAELVCIVGRGLHRRVGLHGQYDG